MGRAIRGLGAVARVGRSRFAWAAMLIAGSAAALLPLAQFQPAQAGPATPDLTGIQGFFKFYQHTIWGRDSLLVNVVSGDLILHVKDYHIAGVAGQDLTVDRYYNSLAAGTSNELGYGWNLSLGGDVKLTVGSGQVTLIDPTGYQAVFTGSGPYTPPPGFDASLTSGSTTPCGTSYEVTYHQSHESLCFSSSGQLQKEEDQHGNTITLTYNGDGTLHQTKDTRNRTVTWNYTSGLVSSIHDDDGQTRNESFLYDANNNPYSFTDVQSNTTTFGYDTSHNLTDIKDPTANGQETKLQYDTYHRVTEVSYVNNATSGTTYNAHFYYNSSKGPCTASSAVNYTTVSDEDGHQTKYCFDGSNRVVQVIDAKNQTQGASYDANNNPTGYTDQASNSWSSTYSGPSGDPYNENLTQFQQPAEGSTAGASTSAAYGDTAPYDQYSPTSITSPQGSAFASTYDGQGDQSSLANGLPANNTVKAYYNGNGTLIGLLDAKGTQACTPTYSNPTQPVPSKLTECYAYDSLSQLSSITYPSPLGARSFTWDSLSRLHVATDGKSQTATYTYDRFDRVVNITFSDTTSIGHDYDADGNMETISDSTGKTIFKYDLLNRVSQKILPNTVTTQFVHDGAGLLTQITDDLGTIKYGYDSTNFLTTVTDQNSQQTTYTPDSKDNRVKAVFPNGSTVNQTFDNSNRITEIKVTSSNSTVLQDLTYSYLNGSSKDTNLRYSAVDHVRGNTTNYTYDSLDRLTEASTTGNNPSDYKYSYDANSNLCRTDGQSCQGGSDPYQYNSANELTSFNGTTYNYDANGNFTGTSTSTFSYNAQDQMTSSVVGTTTTTYTYSGNGQSDRVGMNATVFRSTQLGIDYQNDTSGTTHYVRDSRGNLVEEILPSGTHEYYVFDALGSVTGLTDGSSSLVNSYRYDPYGNVVATTGSTANPCQYTSSFNDALAATGFDHMGARYYAPGVQRWTQIDPINNPIDTHGWNRFFYVGDDPTNYADLNGRCNPWELGFGAFSVLNGGAAIIGGVAAFFFPPFGPVAGVFFILGGSVEAGLGAADIAHAC